MIPLCEKVRPHLSLNWLVPNFVKCLLQTSESMHVCLSCTERKRSGNPSRYLYQLWNYLVKSPHTLIGTVCRGVINPVSSNIVLRWLLFNWWRRLQKNGSNFPQCSASLYPQECKSIWRTVFLHGGLYVKCPDDQCSDNVLVISD